MARFARIDSQIRANRLIHASTILCGRFGYFLFFFLLGEGEGAVRRRRNRLFFFMKIPGGGGFPGGGGPRGREGVCGELGIGLNIFFSGPKRPPRIFRESLNGGSQMGALKWGLNTIVRFCGLFGPISQRKFRRKMTTIVGNRGQFWTSALSPHLLNPHLDFPDNFRLGS